MLVNKAFKSDSQRLAVSLRSSIAKRRSHLNAALEACYSIRLHLSDAHGIMIEWLRYQVSSMNVSITKILSCKSVEELKSLDSYLGLKRLVEDKLGFKLHVKGWVSLFNRIKSLKSIVSRKKNELERIPDAQSFVEAKRKANNVLGFKINAKELSKLKEMLSSLISVFSQAVFSAHERFESTKVRNFIHSSRLEGIDISSQKPEQSLDSILAKYRVKHG